MVIIHTLSLSLSLSLFPSLSLSQGLEKIESLQNHPQHKIYLAATKLLDRYFNDSSIAPDSTTDYRTLNH